MKCCLHMRLLLYIIFLVIVSQQFSSCVLCMGGGTLIAKQNYIYNKCRLPVGVTIFELAVDSFSNARPAKYSLIMESRLYLTDDKRERKKLFYSKHCYSNCPLILKNSTWYSVNVDNYLQTFFYVDNNGKVISAK